MTSAGPYRYTTLLLSGLGASLVALWLGPAVIESWFLAVLLLAGLAVGSLGLLMIGHLLGELWLEPVRQELEAASLAFPLIAILAAPLAWHLEDLYPWAAHGAAALVPAPHRGVLDEASFVIRGAAYFAVWTALASWMSRRGRHRFAGAVGLFLFAPTVSLAATDWLMSREPHFWSSLFGFSFMLTQMLAALAGAIMLELARPGRTRPDRLRSLERALLTLAILVLWVWFAQFIIVWLANLPDEAAWYLKRADWSWLQLAIVLPATVGAIAIMIAPRAGRRRMLASSALILIQHVGQMIWLVRPSAIGAPSLITDGLVLAALTGLSALWLAEALRQRDRPDEAAAPERPHDQRGTPLSRRVASGSGGASG